MTGILPADIVARLSYDCLGRLVRSRAQAPRTKAKSEREREIERGARVREVAGSARRAESLSPLYYSLLESLVHCALTASASLVRVQPTPETQLHSTRMCARVLASFPTR